MLEAIRAGSRPARIVRRSGLRHGTAVRLARGGSLPRGYRPMNISHYRAGWVGGSDHWAVPEWPTPEVSAFLYGDLSRNCNPRW
jgi:endoglucanase